MKTICLNLKGRSYKIIIGQGVIRTLHNLLRNSELGKKSAVVTNRSVVALHGRIIGKALQDAGIKYKYIFVPPNEKAKSFRQYLRVAQEITNLDKDQDIFLIAFGGGVVGDLAGFVAATYKRGISYIQIPTTLLAQVDSSIGGKTAIDLPIAKNTFGAFYQPRAVITDVSFLKSLPSMQIRSGLAEIIKYAVIKDESLFSYLESNIEKILRKDLKTIEHVIWRSAYIKARVVEEDEFDKKDARIILNFGHTLGHAIESASGYSGYSHGQAVAIGMLLAGDIALHMKLFKECDLRRLEHLIERALLPISIKRSVKMKDIMASYAHDKKIRKGIKRLIIPVSIGKVKIVENIPDSIIKKVLAERFQ